MKKRYNTGVAKSKKEIWQRLMKNYVIYVDSACDIARDLLGEWGVKSCGLSLMFSDDVKEYSDYEIPSQEFYNKMREGALPKTSAANMAKFREAFEAQLKEGKDVLYLGFTSGLSATYNFAREAAAELMDEYPDSKILTVDTLCASAGYGLLVYLAVQQKNNGASMQEVYDFAENIKLKITHWFTVEDLKYLKAGGRISPTTALVGSVLGIKPIMKVDNEGRLISVSKVRGRRASLETIAEKYGEYAETVGSGTIFISHGDCIDDANYLADTLKTKYGVKVDLITNIGPVIGSHSGPGTMALFFVAKER